MRATLLGLVALTCVATADVAAQRQIQLFATIVNTTGDEITSLDPSAIRILEDGVEGKVLEVEPVERPLKVQVLIDNGIGLGAENIQILRTGVRDLLEALPQGIEITLVTTAPQPRFLVRATNDREALLQGVNRLGPDSGAGRFVESLHEATQRIERDRDEPTTVIIAVGTSAGDSSVRDRDMREIIERVQRRPTTVHVVLLSGPTRSGSGGAVQGELGQLAAQVSGGRFENIAAASRIATLLPELAAQVGATQGASGAKQFRITAERPSGAQGDFGRISVGATGGLAVVSVTFN